MSATVKYKGQTLGTVSNTTKKLTTKGMYCEDDIEITDSGGGGGANLTHGSKSVTPSETAYSGTETPPTGYDGFDQFTVNVGAISSDYVGSGVSRQAAQTIHPSTSDQTIAADKYLTGAQTVKGVLLTNLLASVIKKDEVVKIGDSDDDDCVASITGTYEGSGGFTYNDMAANSIPTGDVVLSGTRIENYAFAYRNTTPDWTVYGPNVTYMGQNAFRQCRYLTSARFPALTSYHSTSYVFYMPTSGTRKLALIDWGLANVPGNWATNCTNLKTIILRKSTIATLANTNSFNGTPLASGGSGCTIYIPKALYDHLGDNSSSDYKKASNWSTIDARGTITWAKIEGSIYEL